MSNIATVNQKIIMPASDASSQTAKKARAQKAKAARAFFKRQRVLYEEMVRNTSAEFKKVLKDLKKRSKENPKLAPHIKKLEAQQKQFEAKVAAGKIRIRQIESKIS